MRQLLPLIPDGDQARAWLESELSAPAYAVTEPTWFDRTAQAVRDTIIGLFSATAPPEWIVVLAAVAGLAAIGVIIAVIVFWRVPHRRRRRPARTAVLFGRVDHRPASSLRAAAEAAASRGDWRQAITLRFRAAARGVDERGLLALHPGTTTGQFASDTAPMLRTPEAVARAAAAFDSVRYAQSPGTAAAYAIVRRADEALQGVADPSPATADAVAGVP
ncbi:DUF4129 domain-containing protein [Microbacterium sediminicola]|uniref:DUF4129 domain-containing protein n=1 Tax=Microbacterium sediminicola TaxID=415210 RepID=UPI0031DA4D6A